MKDTKGYITQEQFNHLIGYAKNERDHVLLTFIFYTGRRVSEVVRSLTPRDFNFRDSMVHFTILKRKRPMRKWINVHWKIMGMMRNYIQKYDIFETSFIFPISRFRVDQIIKDLGKRANMLYIGNRKIHAHMLRHSYAIIHAKDISNIMELKKLQSVMGHANIESTSYYLEHFNPEEMKKFVDKVNI